MTTTSTPWRSVKTDPPKLEDFPVVACNKYRSRAVFWEHDHHWSAGQCEYDYWRSIKCDPPPRELTQREKDEEAFKAWRKSEAHWADAAIPFSDVWHAALAWEREAVEKELIQLFRERVYIDDHVEHFFRDFFRARREGGATK